MLYVKVRVFLEIVYSSSCLHRLRNGKAPKVGNEKDIQPLPGVGNNWRSPVRCLGIIGRDPSDAKSNRFHVVIFQVFYLIKLRYIS